MIKLNDEFVQKVAKKHAPDSSLAKEGEAGSTMFIICSGKVGIFKSTPTGEKMIASLVSGDFFGEMALLGTQPVRGASVKCLENTQVVELNKEAFEALIKKSPDIAMNIMRSLAERLRDTNAKAAALMQKDDYNKISSYLKTLSFEKSYYYKKEDIARVIKIDPTSLTSTLGVSSESARKYFDLAHKSRIATINSGWIYIPQPQYLAPFAEFLLKNQL